MEAIITIRNVVAAPVRDSVQRGGGSARHPLGRHTPWQTPASADPPQTATAADGMHPTGMHSCSY